MQCVDRRKESWNHSKIKVLPSTSIVADLAKRLEPSITNQCTPGWPHFIKMRSFLENTRPMIWHYTCTLVETPDDFGSSRLKAEQESKKQWTKTFCQVIGLRKLLCGVLQGELQKPQFYVEGAIFIPKGVLKPWYDPRDLQKFLVSGLYKDPHSEVIASSVHSFKMKDLNWILQIERYIVAE